MTEKTARTCGPHWFLRRFAGLTIVVGGIFASQPAGAALRGEFIDPVATDPAIDPLLELPSAATRDLRHYVAIDPAVTPRNQLFLFFPGSGGLPEDYQLIANLAASSGFHVISLAYNNWPSVEELISPNNDPVDSQKIRYERLFGEDQTPLVSVDQSNSITNRTVKLLQYLEAHHPGEGWGNYLDSTVTPRNAPSPPGVRWPFVLAGGHSQGAGWAGFLTKLYPLTGAIYWSGPGDLVGYNPPVASAWDSWPSLVPAARQFALVHQREPAESAWIFDQDLFGLSAFGPLTSVDGPSPPYGNTHKLVTNLQPAVTGAFHSSTAADNACNKQLDGTPTLIPAWRYMLQSAPYGCPTILVQPQPATGCPALPAAFSITVSGGAPFVYDWQLETSPGVWQSLGNDPLPLPCGGGAFATVSPIFSAQVHINVHPCHGVSSYQVRCVASNICRNVTSTPVTLTVVTTGDMNCDCRVNNFDIDPFVLALINPGAYAAAFPACDRQHGDITDDGQFNNFDIDPFVTLIVRP